MKIEFERKVNENMKKILNWLRAIFAGETKAEADPVSEFYLLDALRN